MYYGVTICLVSLATALTVFTLNIHYKGLRARKSGAKTFENICLQIPSRVLFIQLDPPDNVGADEVFYHTYDVPEMEPLTRSTATVPGAATDSLFSNGGLSPPLTNTTSFRTTTTKVPKDDFETQFLRVLQKLYTTIERNEVRRF